MQNKNEILCEGNIRECLGNLIRRLRKRSRRELPSEDGKWFKSFAEFMKVNDNDFKCCAISLAIVRQEPVSEKQKNHYLASLEVHALDAIRMIDMSIPIIIATSNEVLEYLHQDDSILLERITNGFLELNR